MVWLLTGGMNGEEGLPPLNIEGSYLGYIAC